MTPPSPSQQALDDLITDLLIERRKLEQLVGSLAGLLPLWDDSLGQAERVDAAALRLQSFYTGLERCFTQIVRVFNGAPPEGQDWHRRLLARMALDTPQRPALLDQATAEVLAELLRFRHVVRHLYAYELKPEQVHRLLTLAVTSWPQLESQLLGFEAWCRQMLA
jgi:hypothetical protein